jgi:hypothetical protein
MAELIIKNKQQYLDHHYPFTDTPQLTDKKRCIHCNNIITVGDFKVFQGENGFEFICCPGAPDCNETVIDWVDLKRLNKNTQNRNL